MKYTAVTIKSTHHSHKRPARALKKYRPNKMPKEIRQTLSKATSHHVNERVLKRRIVFFPSETRLCRNPALSGIIPRGE